MSASGFPTAPNVYLAEAFAALPSPDETQRQGAGGLVAYACFGCSFFGSSGDLVNRLWYLGIAELIVHREYRGDYGECRRVCVLRRAFRTGSRGFRQDAHSGVTGSYVAVVDGRCSGRDTALAIRILPSTLI